jgi:enoyl-CoA hydratase
MAYKTILFEVEGAVATLTFNRPEKLNALNQVMIAEVREVLDRLAGEPQIRVLILTGQGRAFIAGADIKEFLTLDPLSARHFAGTAHEVGAKIEALGVPVIAAVNGFALGGGCEMAMACDIIYAAEEARFGQPEINLGLIPGFGGTQRLARLVGKVAAKEMCLTGRIIDALEAKAMGLVARVFPGAALMEETIKVALSLGEKSRGALKTLKRVMDQGLETDLRTGCALELDGFALCFASPDAKEGATAFLEKRPPRFGK